MGVKLRKTTNVIIILVPLNWPQVSAYRAGRKFIPGVPFLSPRILWRSQGSHIETTLGMSSGHRSTLAAFVRDIVQVLGVPCWQMAMLSPCHAGLKKLPRTGTPNARDPASLKSPLDPATSRNSLLFIESHVFPGLWEFSFSLPVCLSVFLSPYPPAP